MPASATQIKVPPPTESKVPAAFKAKVLPYQGQSPCCRQGQGPAAATNQISQNPKLSKIPPSPPPTDIKTPDAATEVEGHGPPPQVSSSTGAAHELPTSRPQADYELSTS